MLPEELKLACTQCQIWATIHPSQWSKEYQQASSLNKASDVGLTTHKECLVHPPHLFDVDL